MKNELFLCILFNAHKKEKVNKSIAEMAEFVSVNGIINFGEMTAEQLIDYFNNADYTNRRSWELLSGVIKKLNIDLFEELVVDRLSDLTLVRLLIAFTLATILFENVDENLSNEEMPEGKYLNIANSAKKANDSVLIINEECERRNLQITRELYNNVYENELITAFNE